MRIVLATTIIVFSCLQSSAQEETRYFSRGPRTSEEEFFLRHLETTNCRINGLTVLVPYRGAKSPVVGVVASSEPGGRSYEIRFAEGTAKSWREPNEIELDKTAREW